MHFNFVKYYILKQCINQFYFVARLTLRLIVRGYFHLAGLV